MTREELKALLTQYWLGLFLATVAIGYLIVSWVAGRPILNLTVVWLCSFIGTLTLRLAYGIVEVFLERMFKKAKMFICVSGVACGIIVVILIFLYPSELFTNLMNFWKYLQELTPFFAMVVLGLASGFLLASFFYPKLE